MSKNKKHNKSKSKKSDKSKKKPNSHSHQKQQPKQDKKNNEELSQELPSDIVDSLPLDKGVLRVLPLGGLNEIGMNCMVLETQNDIIIIDCGVMFSDMNHFGVEFVIPGFKYLVDRKEKVRAIIFTHGHEDHIGALPYLLKAGVSAPIFASRFTALMLKEKLTEHGLFHNVKVHAFKMGGTVVTTTDFKVDSTSVNHSIVDAAALIIQTPVGQVVHTGDFRIDPTPFFGSQLDETVFKKAGEDGVTLLLSDSTNVERCEVSMSESVVYKAFEELFAAAEGLTMIAMFSSNVARMAQAFEIAKKQDRKIALSGRSMEQNFKLGLETGHIKDVGGTLISLDQIDQFQRDKVIVLTTGTQGEYRSALMRVANGEHSTIELQQGDRILMSSRFIPGNEKAVGRMINQLFKQGADVLYEATHQIHASGHATRPELKKMMEWTKPRFFMPIHGEYRHLVHHAKVAEETGMTNDRIMVATNGAIVEITRDSFQFVYQMDEEPRTMIDGSRANEITKDVLKERRKLAESGVIFVLFTMDTDLATVISGPEVILKGIGHVEMETDLLDRTHKVVRKILRDRKKDIVEGYSLSDVNEEIRIEVRRMVSGVTGKKPVVVVTGLSL